MSRMNRTKLDFIVNYRLDAPKSSNIRAAKLPIPTADVRDYENKDEYLLYFCGKVAELCNLCLFYKDPQVMAPFLERPIRIKYMIVLPKNVSILLDAALKDSELRRKAKELKYYFDIAKEQNKTDLDIKHSILLTKRTELSLVVELEKEYGIKIMTLKDAIRFVGEEM